jgi:phosphoribosylformylglycinamidine cyclo-ligase
MSDSEKPDGLSYKKAGVDIEAGNRAVERIKGLAARTFNEAVLTDIGSFGGMFRAHFPALNDPVLVSSADGVGTKLRLAFMTDNHTTVGADLVNHCIDDILVQGAQPLFFMDYIGTGLLDPDVIADLVEGLSRACVQSSVALLGGETAELPDFYAPGEYDLAGFIVGVVDREKIVDGSAIREGDVCLGLKSDGLHTNGYTLARKIAFEVAGLKVGDFVDELGGTIDEILMQIHRCYAPAVLGLLEEHSVSGMAHITGGGIVDNLRRILPRNLDAKIDASSWPVPAVFEWLQKAGRVERSDMFHAFNMGIGFVLVVRASDEPAISACLTDRGETCHRIGEIVSGSGKIALE